jgi:hypothetical protein
VASGIKIGIAPEVGKHSRADPPGLTALHQGLLGLSLNFLSVDHFMVPTPDVTSSQILQLTPRLDQKVSSR